MGVTVEEVRKELNNAPEGVISSDMINLFIEDAEKTCTENGITDGVKWIRKFAAYHSWVRGFTYNEVKMEGIRVKQDWDAKAAILKKEMEDEWAKLSETYVIDVTPMYDNRPSDPYETGEKEYGSY